MSIHVYACMPVFVCHFWTWPSHKCACCSERDNLSKVLIWSIIKIILAWIFKRCACNWDYTFYLYTMKADAILTWKIIWECYLSWYWMRNIYNFHRIFYPVSGGTWKLQTLFSFALARRRELLILFVGFGFFLQGSSSSSEVGAP